MNLSEIAKQAMLERHLAPTFSKEALKECDSILEPAKSKSPLIRDMRDKLWFSLDNDNSKDLDQITYAEIQEDQAYKIYIAIADVDSLVKKGSPLDRQAQQNTTSVYTPSKIFPMLPNKLSTDFTSLNEGQERLAIVAEMNVERDGTLNHFFVYWANVKNHAKLAYNSVSAWLDGIGPPPDLISKNIELEAQVRLQDQIAELLFGFRHRQGALTLETIEPAFSFKEEEILNIQVQSKNRGRNLIEDFMIAANRATVNFLIQNERASLRRVVRQPKRWERIVVIAQEFGEILPSEPDVKALEKFLVKRRLADPQRFPELSLTIIKLIGNGEYIVEYPGDESIGHFSLAVKDYAHSTAPNRRYPDLITQRLIKSVLEGQPSPYSNQELEYLAKHCSQKEDDAEKVERKMKKAAACLFLSTKINQTFDAIVTGAAPKGTWVRIINPPTEGKLIQGFEHVDVGDQIRVKLVSTDVEKGFIDFIRV